jgi:hypothetical protein
MTGSSKLLASKGIQIYTTYNNHQNPKTNYTTLTCGGYANVKRIAISKCKATDHLHEGAKKYTNSSDYVLKEAARIPGHKLKTILLTIIGKRPIYKWFINHDNCYYPLRCMLDLGSTSFIISPNAA